MKLFENGVGRPSNEIKKKRRIFIASIVAIVALVLTLGGMLLFKSLGTENLQGASAKKLSLDCPASVAVNQVLECYADGATHVEVSPSKNLAKGYNKKAVPSSGDGNMVSFKFTKKGTIYVTAKSGTKTVRKKVEIKDKLYFGCWTPGYVNKEFKCETNYPGVKITVGGAKSLASGYKSSFTTTSSDMTKSIKYTNKLFTDYKNLIKKTKAGAEYITAIITAEKKGYNKITKKIRIYRELIKLNCPSYTSTSEEFKCSVNQSGVKITVGGAKSLSKGYTSSFTTTSSDMTKSIKYDLKLFTDYKNLIKYHNDGGKYIMATITATKPGYITVKEQVEVNYVTRFSFFCPTSAKVNEEFICRAPNVENVKITVGGANSLAAGYTSSFVTTANDKTKSIKYTSKLFTNYKNLIKKDSKGEYIPAIITAEKEGRQTEKLIVKIYR